ncbi:MAG: DUF2339 domain-containing protein [Verrucomicrobiota bacterium]
MHPILPSFFLLGVFLFVYYKLRAQLNNLKDNIENHDSTHQKLQDSNRALKIELKRIEQRMDRLDPKTDNQAEATTFPRQDPEPIAEEKIKPIEKSPTRKTFFPPPLPPSVATVSKTTTDQPPSSKATNEAAEQTVPPSETTSSFFDRIPWRAILERLHLWPPSKAETGESAETQLASWWAIRGGLILVIIGAVFSGIYVSLHTPPILRVLALLLVSSGTVFLGTRMKEPMVEFGRAITAGGFALLYFTAFAAFALPATKVIDSPSLGILAQVAALFITIAWSLWKKDQSIASLTLLLGFVSCAFSHSYDLDRFALIGLVLLAATGAFLFAQRAWLITFIISLLGSWICYAAFILLDWRSDDAPSFIIFLSALIALTVIFESSNLVAIARKIHPLSDRWRRWIILSNTSVAALLAYALTRLIYPDQLSTFYFIFALLYFSFTLIHYFRSTDQALTETLFLKSSALLCLGFASAFDGPVRWLAIAFQSFALLWTARRSHSRWIALGFALVFVASVGWFWRDLILIDRNNWLWIDTFRIAGFCYLLFLTVQLSLHSYWFPSGIATVKDQLRQTQQIRLAGALLIGVSAIAFALNPSTRGITDPIWFMLLLSLGLAALSPLMRQALPCFAAIPPLFFSYLTYAFLSSRTSQSTAALLLGTTLIALSFAIVIITRRYWPQNRKGEMLSRNLSLTTGLAILLPFTYALTKRLSISQDAALVVFALIPLLATAALMLRHSNSSVGLKARASTAFPIICGLIVLFGSLSISSRADYLPAALALSSLPLLATLFRIHSSKTAFAGAIPLLGSYFFLCKNLLETPAASINHDAANLVIIVISSLTITTLFWEKCTDLAKQKLSIQSETLIHGLALFAIHLFLQKHLGEGPDFFASSLLGLGLLIVSRRFPFRTLSALSWIPIVFAIFSALKNGNWEGVSTGQNWFLMAGLTTLAHVLLGNYWIQKSTQAPSTFVTDTLWLQISPLTSFIALGSWLLVVLAATPDPWQAAALGAVALLYSALWSWKKIDSLGPLSLAPLVLASGFSFNLMLSGNSLNPLQDLFSILISACAFLLNGIILANAQRHLLKQKITDSSILPWLHASAVLLITFTACASDFLVSEKLTAVFWGIAAIVVFISGLFAGLRAYRLTGLIGLLFCIAHIFIWDIQDTLYRILSFFAIGLVMLIIAYLYNKFRDRIAAMDS